MTRSVIDVTIDSCTLWAFTVAALSRSNGISLLLLLLVHDLGEHGQLLSRGFNSHPISSPHFTASRNSKKSFGVLGGIVTCLDSEPTKSGVWDTGCCCETHFSLVLLSQLSCFMDTTLFLNMVVRWADAEPCGFFLVILSLPWPHGCLQSLVPHIP